MPDHDIFDKGMMLRDMKMRLVIDHHVHDMNDRSGLDHIDLRQFLVPVIGLLPDAGIGAFQRTCFVQKRLCPLTALRSLLLILRCCGGRRIFRQRPGIRVGKPHLDLGRFRIQIVCLFQKTGGLFKLFLPFLRFLVCHALGSTLRINLGQADSCFHRPFLDRKRFLKGHLGHRIIACLQKFISLVQTVPIISGRR